MTIEKIMDLTKKKYFLIFIFSSSITLLLIIDFVAGGYLLPCHLRQHLTFSRCKADARISHPVYHHDLVKNYRGLDLWGPIVYKLCTDKNGFKISCEIDNSVSDIFDIAFIGDSFTEGIGLEYEHSIVGQISKGLPDFRIANLGVSSYSPSIYLTKVRYLLDQGIKFKELIVYIDISDIQDEAVSYVINNGIVVDKHGNQTPPIANGILGHIKSLLNWAFPITYRGLLILKKGSSASAMIDQDYLSTSFTRGAWTYNPTSKGYGDGGVKKGIEQSLKAMELLSNLLNQKGIALSIGVYPWPAQILFDVAESEQVRIWREFCRTRCVNFYNSFETFFSLKGKTSANKVIDDFFIAGDVHHNARGAAVIAADFLKQFKRVVPPNNH